MRNVALGALGAILVIVLLVGAFELGRRDTSATTTTSTSTTVGQTETFSVPSGAMEPTIRSGATITVSTSAYLTAGPAVGDIIVFHAPPSEHCGDPSVTTLVKRIVGLPGDTISSSSNHILVDDKQLDQTWQHYEPLLTPITRQVIPPQSYFVLGDNHPASCDSRDWGALPGADIIGKVVAISQ